MIQPIFGLESSVDVPVARTFYKPAIEPVLWVKLPCAVRHLTVTEVLSESGQSIAWNRDPSASWISISTDLLGQEVGFHRYRIELSDLTTQWTTHVWFAYNIQDNSPEKPYYYMANQRDEE